MNAKKIVVTGATGSLGTKIVNALIDQGAEVTAMVRASSCNPILQGQKTNLNHYR